MRLADGVDKPVGAGGAGLAAERRHAGHQIAVDHDMFVPVGAGRSGDIEGAGVEDIGEHHRIAGDPSPGEIVRRGRQQPQPVARRALDDPPILHRLAEEVHGGRTAGHLGGVRAGRGGLVPAQTYAGVVRGHDHRGVVVEIDLREVNVDVERLRRLARLLDFTDERLLRLLPKTGHQVHFGAVAGESLLVAFDFGGDVLAFDKYGDLLAGQRSVRHIGLFLSRSCYACACTGVV